MLFLGIDIGTGSSKGVLVDEAGRVVDSATRTHVTSSPRPGMFEHDAEAVWWADVVALCRALLETRPAHAVAGVCVSGIGPAVVVADAAERPLRPAILYGIDSRAQEQIRRAEQRYGQDVLLRHIGNRLTTQSVGPKLEWIADEEPEVWSATRRIFSAPGYVVHRLTGEYTLDTYSASTSDPLYDLTTRTWWEPAWKEMPDIERPRLARPGEVVGTVTAQGSAATGLPVGVPVLAGTIDALAEAYSAGCRNPGDTMIMYGSTLFMIQTVDRPSVHPGLWAAEGRTSETFSIAAGMSTSGLITNWLSDLTRTEFGDLIAGARGIAPGSDGLLLLPYFAGERTPVFDPEARGVWMGLSLRHGKAHLYRSVLEGVAFGVRHNLAAMADAGSPPRRLVAVGGGTREDLWAQIVSDVTGMAQDVPSVTIGACYGDARMVAEALGVDTGAWNPVAVRLTPEEKARPVYDELYRAYLSTYPALRETLHTLAAYNR
jgi:xylulokinase